MKPQTLAGILLIASLSAISTCGYITVLRRERDAAVANATQATLEANGFKKALAVKPTEVTKYVDRIVTKEVTKLIHDHKVDAVAGSHSEGKTEVITVPCPPPTVGGKASSDPFTMSFTDDLFIAHVRHGTVDYVADFSAKLESTDLDAAGKPRWSEDLVLKPEAIIRKVTVSAEVGKALDEYNRPWLSKHLRVQCPGVGVTYDGKVGAAVTCTYGLTW